MAQPHAGGRARRLSPYLVLAAGITAVALATACSGASLRPRPPRHVTAPCKYNPVSCPDPGVSPPAARDTTRPRPERS